MADRKITRRRLLIGAGAGLVIAGGGYFILNREEAIDELYGELSDYLEDHPDAGAIRSAHRGDSSSAILAVWQRHKDPADIIPEMQAARKGIIDGVLKTAKPLEDDPQLREEMARVGEEALRNFNVPYVVRCQKEIYDLLRRTFRELDGPLAVGTEGEYQREVTGVKFGKLSFDAEGNPIADEADLQLLFSEIMPAYILKAAYGEKVRIFGLEDKTLMEKATQMLKANVSTRAPEFVENCIQRHKSGIDYLREVMRGSGARFGALIYGAAHFDSPNGTQQGSIPNYLREVNQSYIEFVPSVFIKKPESQDLQKGK